MAAAGTLGYPATTSATWPRKRPTRAVTRQSCSRAPTEPPRPVPCGPGGLPSQGNERTEASDASCLPHGFSCLRSWALPAGEPEPPTRASAACCLTARFATARSRACRRAVTSTWCASTPAMAAVPPRWSRSCATPHQTPDAPDYSVTFKILYTFWVTGSFRPAAGRSARKGKPLPRGPSSASWCFLHRRYTVTRDTLSRRAHSLML